MMDHHRSTTDKVLLRAKDIAIIVSIITAFSMIYRIYQKPAQWDKVCDDMNKVKPIVEKHEIDIAVLKVTLTQHYESIMSRLARIDNKLDR